MRPVRDHHANPVGDGVALGKERFQQRRGQRSFEVVADLAALLVVGHHDDGMLRVQHGRHERISLRRNRQQTLFLREIVQAIQRVNAAPQELGHIPVQAEGLLELDLHRVAGLHRLEQGTVDRVILEGPPRLILPVVLHDGRHLAVIPDHDHLPAGPQWQGRHDRLGQADLGRFVKHQQLEGRVIEEVLTLFLGRLVNTTGRRAHDGKREPIQELKRLRMIPISDLQSD